jgi:hypothetical protein
MTPGLRDASLAAVLASVAVCGLSCPGPAVRDSVPPSTDVVADAGGQSRSAEGYDYVARRTLAVVALAEARGIEPAVARAAIERLADAVDACASDERRKGAPVQGAARVVAQIDPDGRVAATAARVDPGAGVAQSAVLCLVAPVRLMLFPPADAGVRGIAVEALWGRTVPAP